MQTVNHKISEIISDDCLLLHPRDQCSKATSCPPHFPPTSSSEKCAESFEEIFAKITQDDRGFFCNVSLEGIPIVKRNQCNPQLSSELRNFTKAMWSQGSAETVLRASTTAAARRCVQITRRTNQQLFFNLGP